MRDRNYALSLFSLKRNLLSFRQSAFASIIIPLIIFLTILVDTEIVAKNNLSLSIHPSLPEYSDTGLSQSYPTLHNATEHIHSHMINGILICAPYTQSGPNFSTICRKMYTSNQFITLLLGEIGNIVNDKKEDSINAVLPTIPNIFTSVYKWEPLFQRGALPI